MEAQSTTLEEESSSVQTISMREDILLLKEQLVNKSRQLSDSRMVLNRLFKDIHKLLGRHYISYIDPLACFTKPVPIDIPYCQAGWLVIQRRMDGSVDFYRGWSDYHQGFGNPSGEFWIGLDTMHSLTQKRTYKLQIHLEAFDGNTRYAEYSTFALSDEAHNYNLYIGTYSGTAGDALTYHTHRPFATKDHRGTGDSARWWYNACHNSNLNGQYLWGNHTSSADGVNWYHWKGDHYSLKTAIMMIKPAG